MINVQWCGFAVFDNETYVFLNMTTILVLKGHVTQPHKLFYSLKAADGNHGILYEDTTLKTQFLHKIVSYEIFQNKQTVSVTALHI